MLRFDYYFQIENKQIIYFFLITTNGFAFFNLLAKNILQVLNFSELLSSVHHATIYNFTLQESKYLKIHRNSLSLVKFNGGYTLMG